MSVSDDVVLAYAASKVVRLAFRPSSDRDKRSWLHQLHESLWGFWGGGAHAPPPAPEERGALRGEIRSPLGVQVRYSIQDATRFGFAFTFASGGAEPLAWRHESDPEYHRLRAGPLLRELGSKKEKEALRAARREHVVRIVQGLVCHPAVHLHPESPCGTHGVRIGGGIGNAFLLLFHLRYQLCPDEATRRSETRRLSDLFGEVVRGPAWKTVPANKLLRCQ